MTRPIRFQPGVLYPLQWLEKRLAGVMSVKTFLDNLGLDCTGRGRMYQNAVWGHEIIRAIEFTCAASNTPEKAHMEVQRFVTDEQSTAKGKRGRPAKTKPAFDPIKVHEVIDGRCNS